MTKKEMAAKIAALEAQVALLQMQVAQQGVPRDTSAPTWWAPPNGWQITCQSEMDAAEIGRNILREVTRYQKMAGVS